MGILYGIAVVFLVLLAALCTLVLYTIVAVILLPGYFIGWVNDNGKNDCEGDQGKG